MINSSMIYLGPGIYHTTINVMYEDKICLHTCLRDVMLFKLKQRVNTVFLSFIVLCTGQNIGIQIFWSFLIVAGSFL